MSGYTTLSDEQLAELAIESEEALYYLMKRYEKGLLLYIGRSVGPQRSEDILQETFIKVYKNLNGFDIKLKFSSWIYRITHNEIVNFYRKNKNHSREIRLDDEGAGHGLPVLMRDALDIQERLLTAEKELNIREALSRLPEKYREIIVLRYMEEKSYVEISDILRVPEGTVATLLNRAKKKLKSIICKNYGWLGEKE